MYGILLASAVPAVLALDFDSPGLALIAAAGTMWAGAAFVCSSAPVVAGASSTVNERVSTVLSGVAALSAVAGIMVLGTGLLT